LHKRFAAIWWICYSLNHIQTIIRTTPLFTITCLALALALALTACGKSDEVKFLEQQAADAVANRAKADEVSAACQKSLRDLADKYALPPVPMKSLNQQ
jgi:hypothetical protein